MTKELEYIQRHIDIVKQQIKGSKMKIIVTDTVTKHQYDYYERELQTLESIEKSIHRLESIDNAEPSEALVCLEYICKILNEKRIDIKWLFKEDYNTIKNALIKAEKSLKALEIIKEKECDVSWLKYCIKGNLIVEAYNSGYPEYHEKLTEEEFNLLKEVLE